VIGGAARLSDADELGTGDAVKLIGPERVRVHPMEGTELILIDVPHRYTPVGVWAGKG
jgi:hypothetical protein